MSMLTKSDLLKNINSDLYEQAKAVVEFNKIIGDEKPVLSKFLKDHKGSLSIYKQQKSSGYSVIVLFKGTCMISLADFYGKAGRDLEALDIPEVNDWHVNTLYYLKLAVLKGLFKDPIDNRFSYYGTFKKVADRVWNSNFNTLFNV